MIQDKSREAFELYILKHVKNADLSSDKNDIYNNLYVYGEHRAWQASRADIIAKLKSDRVLEDVIYTLYDTASLPLIDIAKATIAAIMKEI
jgi:hypothetical protein